MSLKRSRKQMMRGNSTASVKSTDDKDKKKVVRFNDEATTSIPPPPSSSTALEEQEDFLWYTQQELATQLEESKKPVAEWVANGYGVLVANSYLNPHVAVQEYLNAFCACQELPPQEEEEDLDYDEDDDGDYASLVEEDCMRGLESNLAADLKEERSRTRKQHVLAVLASQHSGADACGIYVTSRQSSASSKLFAMRMGRADARWESSTNDAEAAHEIVQAEQESRLQKQHQRSGRRSRSSSMSSSSSYDSLQSLLCMEPRCTSGTMITTGASRSSLTTLPVQEIVFGKFPQSLAA